MRKRRYPELDGTGSQRNYIVEFSSRSRTRRYSTYWMTAGILLGLGLGVGSYLFFPSWWQRSLPVVNAPPATVSDDFQHGINQAMSAAELTQSAEFKEDWMTVAFLWEDAIARMNAVPPSSANYAIAQQKAGEYERNLAYAQTNVQTRPASDPEAPRQFWSVGSDRSLVVEIQGIPSQVIRYDTLCREVLYFGDSRVELENGRVSRYDNLDDNLKVLASAGRGTAKADRGHWSIGSSREDVFRFQGTPTRMSGYQALGKEMLYYGNSFIELEQGQVVGYRNSDRNLRVTLPTTTAKDSPSQSNFWTLGANRAEVLQAQQAIPTQINRNDATCEEVLSYGSSTVNLKHGIVTGYDNADQNLRVR